MGKQSKKLMPARATNRTRRFKLTFEVDSRVTREALHECVCRLVHEGKLLGARGCAVVYATADNVFDIR